MQKGFAAILIVIGIVGIGLAWVLYLKQIKITSPRIETVIVKEDYLFTFTLPVGYQIKQGLGDYRSYIADKKGKEIIGFGVSSAGGERTPLRSAVIDGVSFTIDHGENIGCGVTLYPASLKFSPDSLYFYINTWCIDSGRGKSGVPEDVYKQIIESIKFNPQFKNFLLGNIPDETANWKTYISTKLSFSLKYSPQTKITEGGKYGVDGMFIENLTTTSFIADNIQLSITVEENKNSSTLESLRQEFDGQSPDEDIEGNKIKSFLLDGKVAIRGAAGGPRGIYKIISIYKDYIYRLVFEPDINQTGEQIFSTFKFID